MFSVSNYLNSDYSSETTEVTIMTETFLIRRLDGQERLLFSDLSSPSEKIHYLLSHCLLDGETRSPIGDSHAAELIKRYDVLSHILSEKIFEFTKACIDSENMTWGQAVKN